MANAKAVESTPGGNEPRAFSSNPSTLVVEVPGSRSRTMKTMSRIAQNWMLDIVVAFSVLLRERKYGLAIFLLASMAIAAAVLTTMLFSLVVFLHLFYAALSGKTELLSAVMLIQA